MIVGMVSAPVGSAVVWPIVQVTPLPDGSIPTAEQTPEEYQVFDDAVTEYMEERGITAASLAVAVNGDTVHEQGFGWMAPNTEDASPVVGADALFRIASITKPYTKTVVTELVDDGELSMSDHVFCLPGSPSNCHLDIQPYTGELGDSDLREITVQHLFDHTAGWDRFASLHIMFEAELVADALDVPSPPTTEQIAQYVLAQPLDFAPGTDYAYSNFGYAMLGMIIEKVTDRPFVDMAKHVAYDVPLDEVGTAEEDGVDIEEGKTLTKDRNEREPTYHCPGLAWHAFDPYRKAPVPTCWPDGAWALEPMVAAGNFIASAPAVLDFTTNYWLWGEERTGSCGSCWGYFFGSLDGTLTLAEQRTDGLDFVLLMNKRWDGTHGSHRDVRDVLNEAADTYMQNEHASQAQASTAGPQDPAALVSHQGSDELDASHQSPVGHAVDALVYHQANSAS